MGDVPARYASRHDRARELGAHILEERWFKMMRGTSDDVLKRLAAAIALAAIEEELNPWKRRERLHAELVERCRAIR